MVIAEGIAAALASGCVVKAAMVSTAAVTIGVAITRGNAFEFWRWRQHGCGSLRLLFTRMDARAVVNLKRAMAAEARRQNLRSLQLDIFIQDGGSVTVLVPTRRFEMDNGAGGKVCVIPLLNGDGEICGAELWSIVWFGIGGKRAYNALIAFANTLVHGTHDSYTSNTTCCGAHKNAAEKNADCGACIPLLPFKA